MIHLFATHLSSIFPVFMLTLALADPIFYKFPIVIRKDYEDVITKASIIAPKYRSIDQVVDPAIRKVFSDTYKLIEAIDQGDSVKAQEYAFEERLALVNAFCKKYKGILASADLRGLAMLGQVPVIFWTLERGGRYLTRYFVYRLTESGKYLWDPSFSDPSISLIASSYQRALTSGKDPQPLLQTSFEGLGRSIISFKDLGLPFLSWGIYPYNPILSDSQLPQNCKEGLAAFAYSEEILRTGKFDQYASMLTEGSKRKYDRWVSGLNADQKRQYIHDYFEYEKEIKAVVDAAPFVIILYHQQVPEHFTKEPSTKVAYMIKGEMGEYYRTNISFEGYLDDFLKEYDPYSMDTIKLMTEKFLKN